LISDFKKAVNADVPNSLIIDIKQEEFKLAESDQHCVILKSSDSSKKQTEDKEKKGLKEKNLSKLRKEVQYDPQQGPSGILSK
jgi:hypothetical protein